MNNLLSMVCTKNLEVRIVGKIYTATTSKVQKPKFYKQRKTLLSLVTYGHVEFKDHFVPLIEDPLSCVIFTKIQKL